MDAASITVDLLLLAGCVPLFAASYQSRTRSTRPSWPLRLALFLFGLNVVIILLGLFVSAITPDTFEAGNRVILPSALLLLATIFWSAAWPVKPLTRRPVLALAVPIAWRLAVVLYLGWFAFGM
jgi:hypothetical protein